VRASASRDRDTPRIESVDLSGVDGCRDLEVLALVTQHGAYSLLGRSSGDIMRAVHSADPLFAALLTDRVGAALGTRYVYGCPVRSGWWGRTSWRAVISRGGCERFV